MCGECKLPGRIRPGSCAERTTAALRHVLACEKPLARGRFHAERPAGRPATAVSPEAVVTHALGFAAAQDDIVRALR